MDPYSRAATILKKSLMLERPSSKGKEDLFGNLHDTLGPIGPTAVGVSNISILQAEHNELRDISRTQFENDIDSDESSIKNPFLTSDSDSGSYDEDNLADLQTDQQKGVEPTYHPLSEVSVASTDPRDKELHPITDVQKEGEQEPQEEEDAHARKPRKRQRNEENWQQNINKRRRSMGAEYVTKKGKKVPSRQRKIHRCGTCRYRCNEAIDEETRDKIFHDYWRMGDRTRQRDYISHHVLKKGTKSKKPDKRKSTTLSYFLPVKQELVQVCKQTFLGTLGIGEKTVYYTVNQWDENGNAKPEQRGGKNPVWSTPNHVIKDIKDHINSFPAVESHYCRSSTQKVYLDSELNVTKMHDLYVQQCNESGKRAAKLPIYRKVFNNEFNISFHKPKKDLCNTCYAYNNASEQKKEELRGQYEDHRKRKEEARSKKEMDKQGAHLDESTKVCTFDLQAVLQTPKSNISTVYYKRKLNSYNFTVYDLVTRDCHCYMWHEGIAKRGSNDIASCLYDYLLHQPQKKFKLYSDACGGQNRNHNMAAMLSHVVQATHIEEIEHTYMETGHSQMEVDSVHSTIERAARNLDVGAPCQYETVVQLARKKNPYCVHSVDTKFFQDFSGTGTGPMKKNTNGENIKWLKVKRFLYLKNRIQYSYDYTGEMMEIAMECPRRSSRNRHDTELPMLYASPPSISEAKYQDLMSLCKSGVIDKAFHSFYANLCHHSNDDDED